MINCSYFFYFGCTFPPFAFLYFLQGVRLRFCCALSLLLSHCNTSIELPRCNTVYRLFSRARSPQSIARPLLKRCMHVSRLPKLAPTGGVHIAFRIAVKVIFS